MTPSTRYMTDLEVLSLIFASRQNTSLDRVVDVYTLRNVLLT